MFYSISLRGWRVCVKSCFNLIPAVTAESKPCSDATFTTTGARCGCSKAAFTISFASSWQIQKKKEKRMCLGKTCLFRISYINAIFTNTTNMSRKGVWVWGGFRKDTLINLWARNYEKKKCRRLKRF